jgi:alanyl-tRNA synthetase
MTGPQIRTRFLEHFRSRDHLVLDSASLLPVRDPTTLFISAGMHPLKPYYQGVSQPPAPRLASCQKCFRTGDLEEVGRTDRHCTFFEMLGNFAPTGDYFKETAIPLAWELVTEGFGLPAERLRVTVHPTDDEAAGIWVREAGLPPGWVHRNEENWWSAGETGPCGPDSEIWYDRGPGYGCGQDDCYPDHCERYLEFWNLVFMQYDRQPDGSLPPLPRPGIDTGMGLERIAAILQGVENIFETDLYRPLMDFVRSASRETRVGSERLIADHLRGMTFVVADGVLPGNEGRGYVLRRLIRRALLHARRLGMTRPLADGVGVVVELMGERYPELPRQRQHVEDAVRAEAERFGRTLEQGVELFERVAARHPEGIPGEEAFKLHDTFGFPLELTQELAAERALSVDVAGFQAAMERQRARSRTMTGQRWPNLTELPPSEFDGYRHLHLQSRVTALRLGGTPVESVREGDEVEVFLERTPFYAEAGGQVGDTGVIEGPSGQVRVEDTQKPGEGLVAHLGTVMVGTLSVGELAGARVDEHRRRQVARHHSATHLLHKALREVLGDRAVQKGSWVGPDHTTFDFPFERALTREELERVGRRVNAQVRASLPFHESLLPYREAVERGAMHLFEEKYGDVVRVVCFGDWTCELCGGTHVENTAEVGTALLTSESSVGAGLRRIDMAVGEAAEDLVHARIAQLGEVARSLGVPPDQVAARVAELRAQLREAERRVEKLQDEVRTALVRGASAAPSRFEGRVPAIMQAVAADGMDDLRGYADRFLESLGGRGVVAVTSGESFVIKVSRDLAGELDANGLKDLFGRGGGRPDLVQGRLGVPAEEAFERLRERLA